ncbi:MAG: AI-2E family transporter [Betaproteobacteria bacterium]
MTDPDRPPPAAAAVAAAPILRKPLAPRHYAWIVAAALVVVAALHWLGPVLTPFLIGAILAYLGTPLVDRAQKRGVPRALSTLVVVLLMGLLIVALFFVLVPLVQTEFTLAVQRLPALIEQLMQRVMPWISERFGVEPTFDIAALRDFVKQNAESAQQISLKLLSGVKAGGIILLSILVNLALIPVVMFYLLRDWRMIVERIDELTPRRWQHKLRVIAGDIDAVLAEFLRGQGMVMVVLATYYAIGLWMAGLDRAFSIGILTGMLVFIPYVGFGLGLILGVVAAALQWHGLPGFLAVLAVYGIGQLLENYVLLPFLVGDRIGLHPLAVIFALLAFGQLFGFAGVLLALPVSAALLVGLRHLRAAYVTSPLYDTDFDRD